MVLCQKLFNILIIIKRHCIIILCGVPERPIFSLDYSIFFLCVTSSTLLCLTRSLSWPSYKNNHLAFSWNCSRIIMDLISLLISTISLSVVSWQVISAELIIKTFIIWTHKKPGCLGVWVGGSNIRLQTVSIMWPILIWRIDKAAHFLQFCSDFANLYNSYGGSRQYWVMHHVINQNCANNGGKIDCESRHDKT